jgi:hypothetical protein
MINYMLPSNSPDGEKEETGSPEYMLKSPEHEQRDDASSKVQYNFLNMAGIQDDDDHTALDDSIASV